MSDATRALAWKALGGLGILAALTPFITRALDFDLDVELAVEVVDHVVPGLVVTGCAAAALARTRLGFPDATVAVTLPAICILAGLWIAVSHGPLLVDAVEGTVPLGTTIVHAVFGPAVVAVALALFVDGYRQELRRPAQP